MSSLPQPAIFAMGPRTHYYLELDLLPGADASRIREVLGGLEGLVDDRRGERGGRLRPGAWTAAGGEVPDELADFAPIVGPDGFTIPADQHDVWVWISGSGYDGVFDTARAIALAFAPIASLASQRSGFTYQDSRDLSGFEDGTENPPLDEAPFLCSVPDGQPGAGGSVVLFQRWVHDLPALHGLEVAQQEAIIGRTKQTSEELDDDAKPADAHISRVVIEEDGEELEVFRRSVPYGDLEEHGLLFVAFSADQARLALMLDRMAGIDDGVRGAITRWSTPGESVLLRPAAERARGLRLRSIRTGVSPATVTRSITRLAGRKSLLTTCCVARLSQKATDPGRHRKRTWTSGMVEVAYSRRSSRRPSSGSIPTTPWVKGAFT